MPPLDPNAEQKPSAEDTLLSGRAVNPGSMAEETIKADLVPKAPEIIRLPQRGTPAPTAPSISGPISTQQSVPRVGLPLPPAPVRPQTGARQRSYYRQANQRQKGGEWAWVVIAAALFGVAVVMSLGMFVLVRASRAQQDIVPTSESPIVAALPTPMTFLNDGGLIAMGQAINIEGQRIVLEPWDGQSRLTVLLMGIDRRPGEKGLSYRTDTMLILSLDPRTGEAGMLSIPRDLWVSVPGYGERRVNEAMVLGELRQSGYGPRLAMETVQYNLGIRINHYVVVDFNAFVTIVDALGGIEVDLDYNINDPLYPNMTYGYDPFYLRAGHHLLDGSTALKFARTRHGDSDISRNERQQEVIMAIKDKATSPEMIPVLLANASQLWSAIRDNFYTDIALEKLIQLGLFVKDLDVDSIKRGGIDFSYLSNYTTASGAAVLIPNRARLGNLMIEIFGANYGE
ncbi:MAG: LCP family protein [Chloroflexi bacterium]|nr:LCP family protein [Chloroflexota bacterium]